MLLRRVAPPGPTAPPDPAVRDFHSRLPGYAPTPLVHLPSAAAAAGVRRVLVKDESARLGLPAFKVLGASWAVARVLARRLGVPDPLELAALRAAAAPHDITLVTATDGNHGRAVARVATQVGVRAHVVVPADLDRAVVERIAAEGAAVERVDADYDAAVRHAARLARRPGTELVQDTAWPGYEQVPGWVVEGYSTLLAEVDDVVDPDVVVVPVGVGSLAQAVVTHHRGRALVVTVEPVAAPCLLRSLAAGERVTVPTAPTAMAGLRCGTVSASAWPVLRDGVAAAVAVTDAEAAAAGRELAAHGLDCGPCGAATLAGLRRAPLAELGVGADATVVLLSTEGAAATG